MSEIPEDVLKAARRVAGEWNLIDAIARAILAERERCATATPEMIAAAWGTWHSRHGGKLGPGPAFVEAINAALAIRSSPDPGKGNADV